MHSSYPQSDDQSELQFYPLSSIWPLMWGYLLSGGKIKQTYKIKDKWFNIIVESVLAGCHKICIGHDNQDQTNLSTFTRINVRI
jgi:hypothetical protein